MFDLEDYVMKPDAEAGFGPTEGGFQLLVGVTHSVLVPGSETEHGRVFVDGGGAMTTEHWMLRPSFTPPRPGGGQMLVRVLNTTGTLEALKNWAREVPGTVYVRAVCSQGTL